MSIARSVADLLPAPDCPEMTPEGQDELMKDTWNIEAEGEG